MVDFLYFEENFKFLMSSKYRGCLLYTTVSSVLFQLSLFFWNKGLETDANRVNKTSNNATHIINQVFKLYPTLLSTFSTNKQLDEHINKTTDQMTTNISHVLKQLERQNTTMLLWKRVTELANQTETIKIVEANTTQIFNHTKSKSKLIQFLNRPSLIPLHP